MNRTRLALAQFAAEPTREQSVEKAIEQMRRASEQGAEIICFPEMAFDPFFPQWRCERKFFDLAEPVPGPTSERFQEAAGRYRLVTVLNLFERAAPGEHYDCSPVIDADGNYLGKSRMMHIAEEPHFNEKFYYWPGNTGYPVYSTKAGRLGLAICYDRHFPEQIRALVVQGAQLILSPFVGLVSDPLDLYEIEMQGASFQNQVFFGVVNRSGRGHTADFAGRSFVTGPSGAVIARGRSMEEDLVIADLDLDLIDHWRAERRFLRDRRPETYDILLH